MKIDLRITKFSKETNSHKSSPSLAKFSRETNSDLILPSSDCHFIIH